MKRSCIQVHQISPLKDARWSAFAASHPRSSVFHSLPWLETLHRTFGYKPIAFTTSSPNSSLENAIVFCRVESWLSGWRLVSLPFSDHCDPLVDDGTDADAVVSSLREELVKNRLRYAEIRPTHGIGSIADRANCTLSYCSHHIDLEHNNVDTLFHKCHKNSTQRKIRRAAREGLTYQEGRTDAMLDQFYRLLLLTRRRHNVPPHPKRWFRNLIDCFGGALKIRLALRGACSIAGILTLRYKNTLVYKYGGSDARFHSLGGMQFLFWNAILEAKMEGLSTFDLGRSEWGQEGLIAFKDHMGASRSELRYSRFSATEASVPDFRLAGVGRKVRTTARILFPHVSDRTFCLAGEFLCRHFA